MFSLKIECSEKILWYSAGTMSYPLKIFPANIFTELITRPIKSKSCVGRGPYVVPSWIPRFPVEWLNCVFQKNWVSRFAYPPTVHSGGICRGGSLDVAVAISDRWQVWQVTCDWWHVTCYILLPKFSGIVWYRWYYPHMSRDSVSPICRFFNRPGVAGAVL